MNKPVQIVEKPDWVSWDEIKQCLELAHEANRAKGINVMHYCWSAEELRDSLDRDAVTYVALDGRKVVGTATIIVKEGHTWYTPGRYGYLGFGGVLPEYNGKGINAQMTLRMEEYARATGLPSLCLFAHERNTRIQQRALKNGFHYVNCFPTSDRDHYDVVMVRWLDGSPFSTSYCQRRFALSRIKARLKRIVPFLSKWNPHH